MVKIEAELRSEGAEIGVDPISEGEGTATDPRVQKTFSNACNLTFPLSRKKT